MTEASDTQNVKTLFEGIAREREALQSGKQPDKSNFFKHINGPPGRGIFFTGDDGWEALWALTDSAMRIGQITNRADRQTVMRTLSDVLMRKFFSESLEINQRNVARALSETFKGVKRKFKTETHFIPCHLSTSSGQLGLSLGSVRFISRNEAKRALLDGLKVERERSPELRLRDRNHLAQVVSHYKRFRWFVQVPVHDFASKKSKDIALSTAVSALDFLHLIIGVRHSRRMSILGRPGSYEKTASISRNEATGSFNLSMGWASLGEIGLPDDWTSQILAGEGQMGLDQAGVILEVRLNPDLERPLSQRLLDALQWFGEATRDTSPSTRVIKYVTSLERLTLTMKVDDVADSVSDRVAALATGLIENRNFEENKKIFKKVYAIRSDLAHGSISPNNPKVLATISEAYKYAEAALRRALYNFSASDLINENFKSKDLDRFFNDLIGWLKTEREDQECRRSASLQQTDESFGVDL